MVILLFPVYLYADTKVPDKILRLAQTPEEKLDIATAALVLAKEVYPGIDIKEYSNKVDSIVKLATAITRGNKDPDYRIRVLNTFLYKTWGLQYDLTDINGRKPENRYLNGILDTKKGSCVTLPLLYLAVSQRMGYPIYPVSAPQHFFLRYVDPSLKLKNIEASGQGGYVPDDEYKYVLHVSEQGIKSGAYMKTLTYKEFIGDLIAQNGLYWARKGDLERAAAYLEISAKLFPNGADIYNSLGNIYKALYKKNWNMAVGMTYFQKAQVAYTKAAALGLVILPDGNYVAQQQKAQAEYRKKGR